MTLRLYAHPEKVGGWLGWVENTHGDLFAFVAADGTFIFNW